MAEEIGARHHTVQRLRRLSRRRRARTDDAAFVIDGPTLLADALDAGIEIEEVVAEPGCSPELLTRVEASGAVMRHAAAGTLARAVDTVTPHAVAAVARLASPPAVDAVAAAGPLALVLVGVGDPGNAGTLLRSAEAAGAGAALFCDESVDPFGPKCVRSSAGSVLRLAVGREGDSATALSACRAAGLRIVATDARSHQSYDDVDLSRPTALVVGSEPHGLPAEVLDAADVAVAIPMLGRAESLNVAMAGTVLCFESLRQRRHGRAPQRADEQVNQLDETPPRAAGCNTT